MAMSPEKFAASLSSTDVGARQLQGEIHAGIGRYQGERGMTQLHPDTSRTVMPQGATQALGEAYGRRHADPVAYRAMHDEVGRQFDFLTKATSKGGMGVSAEVTPHDPYGGGNPHNIITDAAADASRGHMSALATDTTGSGEQVLDRDTNDMFRVVHDYFGHLGAMRGIDRHGEEAAYQSHASMFSPAARPALANETRMQNSYLNSKGSFPEGNNQGGYTGKLSPAQFGENRAGLEKEAAGEQHAQGLPW